MVLRFFIFAAAFLVSCTSEERDSVCDEKSVYYNGCVGGGSSSSTQSGIIYGPNFFFQGENYETVIIGNQVWMARNLNYDAPGSECYENTLAYCDQYGRLYDWATVMNLSTICNSSSCASQIGAKHRGMCPDDWHIPSSAEWNTLINYVGDVSYAGTKLKATSDWNNGSGTNTYGFSALPGGYGSGGFNFFGVGKSGYWWSSSEGSNNYAYSYYMDYDKEYANSNESRKSYMYSVRCVKD
ncbi:MAG: fibrobacter succinogenes major paralogous domain-containing protein [Fibromonadaceae bacterium]|jgi:uncharacterized protein (TIGR02145 family)|nr:fibrobacter succinogenes major paralogous domain-containing protein [Fibromonadaceae bacterium]